MQLVPATTGWFTTAATTANTYVTDISAFTQPQFAPRADPPKPKVTEPLDWLRSRVGEYVEAGALA